VDDEELLPGRKPAPPKDLSLLGLAELEDYIAGLEAEIAAPRPRSPGSESTAAAPRRCSSDDI
jgi:uncharacterized small protein (DUF1192 family)